MKAQYTISLVKRSLLVIIGSAGISSLIFFSNSVPAANLLALAGIIPLILGILGENLIYALFAAKPQVSKTIRTPIPVTPISPNSHLQTTENSPIIEQAA